ncbi:MAG: winged helix-turn-helix domain-containing protein [Acidobacteriota bacterium]
MPLTPKAFETLVVLVRAQGRLVEKDELMRSVWPNVFVEESGLTRNISALRKALSNDSNLQFIETIPKRGYRFVADFREVKGSGEEVPLREPAPPVPHMGSGNGHEIAASPSPLEDHGDHSVPHSEAEVRQLSRWGRPLLRRWLVPSGALLAAILLYLVYSAYRQADNAGLDFTRMSIRPLTTTGRVLDAAVSPDGKYLTYAVNEGTYQSLWVRQIATLSNIQIVPPAEVLYRGLNFSVDGDYIYFARATDASPHRALFRVPALGGDPVKLVDYVSSPITFSPDGSRLAFVRYLPSLGEYRLITATNQGTDEAILAVRRIPDFLSTEGPAWSPDNRLIACGVGTFTGGYSVSVAGFRLSDKSEVVISDRKWSNLRRLAWLHDGSGLMVPARDPSSGFSHQIWFIPYPRGTPRRVTNDLSDYRGMSVTADSRALVTVQPEQTSRICVVPAGDSRNVEWISSGNYDGFYGLAWAPTGQVIYTSVTDGSIDLWRVDPKEGQAQQLTHNAGMCVNPSVTRDGKYVLFDSDQLGPRNIWRLRLSDGELLRLTDGDLDLDPVPSGDGCYVIYSSIRSGKRKLWKVPIEGGQPELVSNDLLEFPAVSPDGRYIACTRQVSEDGAHSEVAVVHYHNGELVKTYPDLPTTPWRLLRWTPDSQSLTYVRNSGGVFNVMVQPMDNGAPRQLTDFRTDRIFSFDWSHDGTQLACARGLISYDAVLISSYR